MTVRSPALWTCLLLAAVALPSAAQTPAAAAASQVYRCPGPPVLYTDALSPQEAREKVGKDTKILDAFIFHNFNIGNQSASVRVGQQAAARCGS